VLQINSLLGADCFDVALDLRVKFGDYYMDKGNAAEAGRHYNEAKNVDFWGKKPKVAEAAFKMGKVFIQVGKEKKTSLHQKAMDAFMLCLSIIPSYPHAEEMIQECKKEILSKH